MKTSKNWLVLNILKDRLEVDDGYVSGSVYPSLTDPGTLGCLLALVAEAYGVNLDGVHVVRTTGKVWSVWIFRADGSSYRVAAHLPSRAEALVNALEAASSRAGAAP